MTPSKHLFFEGVFCLTSNQKNIKIFMTIKQNTKFVLQESEVESVSWLDKSQIDVLIKNGVFRKSSQMHYEKFIK